MTTNPLPDHAWVHDHLAVALTAGLTPDEQSQFDAHIHSCPDCFDAFTEARDADRTLQRTFDSLTPNNDFEDRLITTFREKEMKTHLHPLAKRAGFAIAAAVALAATGVGAQYIVHGNLLNNPLSKQLAEQSDDIPLANPVSQMVNHLFTRHYAPTAADAAASAPPVDEMRESGRSNYSFGSRFNDQEQQAGQNAGLARTGNGELELNGINTYSGHTTINTGTLVTGGGEVRRNRTVTNEDRKLDLRDRLNQEAPQQQVSNSPTVIATGMIADKSEMSAGRESHGLTTNNFSPEPLGNRQLAGEAQKDAKANPTDFYFQVDAAPTSPTSSPKVRAKNEKLLNAVAEIAGSDVHSVNRSPMLAAALPAAPPSPTTQPSNATPGITEVSERKIIRNGTVEFEVRSFDDAFATISSVVGEEGGFVSSTSSDKLANGKVRGSISVRVPPEHLDRLLLKLRALGDLKSQQIGANDITKEYTDLESELRALRAMESRLIDIIKTGNGQVKDLVVAEKQLGEYRVRIEKIEGEIRYYNNLVGMATLTITAYEKDIQTPTAAQEQENISLNVETEDVETKYADARKIIDDAKGRIIESDLKKHDAGQYAAQIVAEVPPDKADFVAAQLKQIGTVAAFTRDRKQTTTGGNGAPTVQVEQKPTRFSISLYNLANIAPRETAVLTIAVRDVENAYKTVLTTVRKESNDTQPKPIGRVITSALNGQQQDQMTADIRADITTPESDNVLQSIRSLGEVMNSSLSENPDTANVTSAKRGLQLRIVNIASVPARESRSITTVAAQVPEAYAKLVADLQTLESAGSAHILASQLNQTDPRTVNANLAFDVRRDALPAIDKAFANAGIDILSRNVARSNDTANTLDSKVHFQIDELKSADALPPRRTTTLGIEADNVEKSLETLRAQIEKDGITHIQYSVSKESSGRVTGRLIVDVPTTSSMTVLGQIHDIGGNEKVNQVVDDPQVPDTRFAKERIDLTLSSHDAIVGNDRGLGTTIRAALGSAAAALLWSLYLIITGVLFVGPWLAIAWLGWKITRRKRASA